MRHAGKPDKLFKVLGEELRAVVRYDSGARFRKLLFCLLKDDLDIRLLHLLPDLPVNDKTTAAVEKAAQVVKRAANVDVRNVYVPMFVGLERLDKAGALLADFFVPPR